MAISPCSPDIYFQQYCSPWDGQGTDKPIYKQVQWNVIAHMEALCITPYINKIIHNDSQLGIFCGLFWFERAKRELLLLLYQENPLASKSPIPGILDWRNWSYFKTNVWSLLWEFYSMSWALMNSGSTIQWSCPGKTVDTIPHFKAFHKWVVPLVIIHFNVPWF